jgi:hypothetical protein
MRFVMRACAMIALAVIGVGSVRDRAAAISYTGTTYTQNFDSLGNSGTNPLTWANDTTIPGWSLFAALPSPTPITTYRYTTGSETNGSFDSFGAAAATERALGGLGSGGAYFGSPPTNTVAGWIAVSFTNDTGSTIDTATLAFDGEQWRSGGAPVPTVPLPQTMVMEYGFGTAFTDVATWTAPGGNFDWESPVVLQAGILVDGNTLGLVAGRGGALTTLGWAAGSNLWIRWVEKNDTGNDHGLAIDNFSLSTGAGPTVNANFDGEGGVNGNDFLIWQRGLGTGNELSEGDADASGTVDNADLTAWKGQYPVPAVAAVGAVPEPGSIALAGAALAGVLGVARRFSGR